MSGLVDIPRKGEAPGPDKPPLGPTLRDILLASGLLALFAVFFARGGRLVPQLEVPSRFVDVKVGRDKNREICGAPSMDGHPVVIEMVYSDDAQPWIDEASNRFAKLCPGIQVKTTAVGGVKAAESILKGELSPTIWMPSDDLLLRYLDERWKQVHGKTPFDIAKQVALARTPLVVVMWEDRLQILEAIFEKRKNGEGPWMDAMCAAVPRDPEGLEEMALEDMVPGTWIEWYNPVQTPPPLFPAHPPPRPTDKKHKPAYFAPSPTLDELRGWGRTKFVHSSPTRSAEGLGALYLMAYDYALPPRERPAALRASVREALEGPARGGTIVRGDAAAAEFTRSFQEQQEPFQRWLKRCEGGLPPPMPSADLLGDALFDVGASRYDGVVMQEQHAFPLFARFDSHADVMAELRIVYPQPTIVNEHPAVIFEDGTTPEQREAAGRWITFLLSDEMQKLAITRGLRPVRQNLKIQNFDEQDNPFLKYRRYGVDIDEVFIEPPRLDGKFVYDLVRAWRDATGRN